MSRLPEGLEPILSNLITSQGCILLLILREHLKEFYGFNEAKITAYNPNEAQKIYERAVNRRGNARFNPKATIEILKQGDVDLSTMDDEGRLDLVKKYLGFKGLMNKIEVDEEEYDEDGNVIPQVTIILIHFLYLEFLSFLNYLICWEREVKAMMENTLVYLGMFDINKVFDNSQI